MVDAIKDSFNAFAVRESPLAVDLGDPKKPPRWWPKDGATAGQDWSEASERASRGLLDRLFLRFCELLAGGWTLSEIASGTPERGREAGPGGAVVDKTAPAADPALAATARGLLRALQMRPDALTAFEKTVGGGRGGAMKSLTELAGGVMLGPVSHADWIINMAREALGDVGVERGPPAVSSRPPSGRAPLGSGQGSAGHVGCASPGPPMPRRAGAGCHAEHSALLRGRKGVTHDL
jgi:hypothetical protein